MTRSSPYRLPQFRPATPAREANRALEEAGWEHIAAGDWAWVYGAPDQNLVARVTPWDPAYLLYAKNCLEHAANPYMPHVEQVMPINADGYIVFMERLQPADPEHALALCHALGLGSDTECPDWMNDPSSPSNYDRDEDLRQLRRIFRETLDYGAAHVPFWGGSDLKPEGVMTDADGRLKIVDPYFVRGRALIEAILAGRRELLKPIAQETLEAFLDIPALSDAPDIEEMRRAVRSLKADPTPRDDATL